MGYRIQKLSDAREANHPFGRVREFFSGLQDLGLARIRMTDDNRHYHKKTTEVYYVLSGSGSIELDGESHEIGPDTAILIEPGTRHRAMAYGGQALDLLVFSMPAYDQGDVFPEAGQ